MIKKERQYNGQEGETIQWSRRRDNTMVKKERQYNDQGETIQWSRRRDNTMVKKERQYNGQKKKDIKTNNDLPNITHKTQY